MWNDVLVVVILLGMVLVAIMVVPAFPKLVDAWCARIRSTRCEHEEHDSDAAEGDSAEGDPASPATSAPSSTEPAKPGAPTTSTRVKSAA